MQIESFQKSSMYEHYHGKYIFLCWERMKNRKKNNDNKRKFSLMLLSYNRIRDNINENNTLTLFEVSEQMALESSVMLCFVLFSRSEVLSSSFFLKTNNYRDRDKSIDVYTYLSFNFTRSLYCLFIYQQ